ncbi:MAG: betaine--homocysteine S-methyltransferase [Gammaproteobacteria bacterium]|nr:betaine--homocysteine S-methyltransferase [Gammaproteobacteria bacterium]
MPSIIERLLAERGVLLADGATGSNLFERGLQTGDAPELWNARHPRRIASQYQAFIDAGSDIILTNTFGGSRQRLQRHAAAHRVAELNRAGAAIARECVSRAGRRILIGGSMGPSGEIMQPLGALSHAEAADAFAEQAAALKDGGADVFWIETMSSREEVQAAVDGAARVGLPIVATFSVDTNGRTMMGLAPADIVALSARMPRAPDAIGANCGVGASELIAATVNMRHAGEQQGVAPLLVAKANCGVPQYIDGKITYSGDAQVMAEYARLAVDAGARIIGGCCGTTPAHIVAMRKALDGHRRGDLPTLEVIESRLGAVSAGARAQLRGEMSIAAGAVGGGRAESRRKGRRRK